MIKLLLLVSGIITAGMCENARQNEAKNRVFFEQMMESMAATGLLMMGGAGYVMSQGAQAVGNLIGHGGHQETKPNSILLSTLVPKTETETTVRTTTEAPTTEKTTTTTVRVSTSQSSCADDTPLCPDLGISICKSNQAFAKTHCRRYCGICGVEMTVPTKLQWFHVTGKK